MKAFSSIPPLRKGVETTKISFNPPPLEKIQNPKTRKASFSPRANNPLSKSAILPSNLRSSSSSPSPSPDKTNPLSQSMNVNLRSSSASPSPSPSPAPPTNSPGSAMFSVFFGPVNDTLRGILQKIPVPLLHSVLRSTLSLFKAVSENINYLTASLIYYFF
jgi:hypothetical protein